MGNKRTERKKRQRQQRARLDPIRSQTAVLEGRLEAANKEYDQLVAEREEVERQCAESERRLAELQTAQRTRLARIYHRQKSVIHPGEDLTEDQIDKMLDMLEIFLDKTAAKNRENGTNIRLFMGTERLL